MMMKKFYLILLCAALCACGGGNKQQAVQSDGSVTIENNSVVTCDFDQVGEERTILLSEWVDDFQIVRFEDKVLSYPAMCCPLCLRRRQQATSIRYGRERGGRKISRTVSHSHSF